MKKNLLVSSLVALATIATLSGCSGSVAKPNFVIPEGGYDGSEVKEVKTITITVKAKPATNNTGGSSGNSGGTVKPTKPKSSNSYLSSLTVDGYELDNKFDKTVDVQEIGADFVTDAIVTGILLSDNAIIGSEYSK